MTYHRTSSISQEESSFQLSYKSDGKTLVVMLRAMQCSFNLKKYKELVASHSHSSKIYILHSEVQKLKDLFSINNPTFFSSTSLISWEGAKLELAMVYGDMISFSGKACLRWLNLPTSCPFQGEWARVVEGVWWLHPHGSVNLSLFFWGERPLTQPLHWWHTDVPVSRHLLQLWTIPSALQNGLPLGFC